MAISIINKCYLETRIESLLTALGIAIIALFPLN